MKKALLMVLGLVVLSPLESKAMECQEGQLVTVAVQFQSSNSSNIIKPVEEGTMMRLDTINRFGDRFIVDGAIVRGIGVRPLLNERNEISGCAVDTKRVESHHICVGAQGYCAAPWAPKKLIFLECELIP